MKIAIVMMHNMISLDERDESIYDGRASRASYFVCIIKSVIDQLIFNFKIIWLSICGFIKETIAIQSHFQ